MTPNCTQEAFQINKLFYNSLYLSFQYVLLSSIALCAQTHSSKQEKKTLLIQLIHAFITHIM